MLLVNGFKPIQTNYNNQNATKANLSQPKFHTKADSVSFGARKSPALMETEAGKQAIALAKKVYNDYVDVCGFENVKAFLENSFWFTRQRWITVYNVEDNFMFPMVKDYSKTTETQSVQASLMGQNGIAIHELVDSEIDVTKTAANVRLFDRLFNGKMVSRLKGSPFKKEEFPDKLKQQSARLVKAMDELKDGWYEIQHSNEDEKIEMLKNVYQALLLGGKPKPKF